MFMFYDLEKKNIEYLTSHEAFCCCFQPIEINFLKLSTLRAYTYIDYYHNKAVFLLEPTLKL